MAHQGEILQETIKNSGISITRIVEELGITRPTMYRKFKDETLDTTFVKNVGRVIGHDFANDFTLTQQAVLSFVTPLVKHQLSNTVTSRPVSNNTLDTDPTKQLLALQAKYITLLESYNELLLKVYGPK